MIVAASQSVVITRDQTDAEGLPAASTHTAVLWKNGEATDISITRTNPATGVYGFAWVIPADAAQYDVWSLRVVDGDGYAATVWEGVTGPITAVLDSAVQAQLNKIEATTAGTTSGAGTTTEVFTGSNATVTVTLDNNNNRTAVVVS